MGFHIRETLLRYTVLAGKTSLAESLWIVGEAISLNTFTLEILSLYPDTI